MLILNLIIEMERKDAFQWCILIQLSQNITPKSCQIFGRRNIFGEALDKTSRFWGKQDSEILLETIFHVEKKKHYRILII